jgi:hypothetical protein
MVASRHARPAGKAVAARCLAVLLLLPVRIHASPARSAVPVTIDVLVTDRVRVSPHIVSQAEQVAADMFLAAGVAIHWTDRVSANPRFSIGIVPREAENHESVFWIYAPMAVTIRTPPDIGGHTSVYYDRVQRRAIGTGTNVPRILGTVMAHEIGHMLLPNAHHAPSGLMQGGWSDEDLIRAQMGALRLTAREAEQIHANLSQALTPASDTALGRP